MHWFGRYTTGRSVTTWHFRCCPRPGWTTTPSLRSPSPRPPTTRAGRPTLLITVGLMDELLSRGRCRGLKPSLLLTWPGTYRGSFTWTDISVRDMWPAEEGGERRCVFGPWLGRFHDMQAVARADGRDKLQTHVARLWRPCPRAWLLAGWRPSRCTGTCMRGGCGSPTCWRRARATR